MIVRSSFRTVSTRATFCLSTTTKRYSSSIKNNNSEHVKEMSASTQQQQQNKKTAEKTYSFMPVVNIPVAELAHNAFYSLHRPLLGLSSPKPFLVANDGGLIGQIVKKEQDTTTCKFLFLDSNVINSFTNDSQIDDEEAIIQYMSSLKPFEPPKLEDTIIATEEDDKKTTTTLIVEVDPSYFLQHNNNHDEIADYLTAMQEKLDLLYDERESLLLQQKKQRGGFILKRKSNTTTRRLRKRSSKGFFEKN